MTETDPFSETSSLNKFKTVRECNIVYLLKYTVI